MLKSVLKYMDSTIKLRNVLETCNLFNGVRMRSSAEIYHGGNMCRYIHTSSLLGRKPGIVYRNGYSFDWAWKAVIPNIHIYTHEPLPKLKTGGRGPDGRIALKCIGGGLKRPHFMVSPFRGGLSNGTESIVQEKILHIHKNWWRHESIALVAKDKEKRWIYATTSMKVGDIVSSHGRSSKIVSNPRAGDAYVIGCLPIGTAVCQVERYPGEGAHYTVNAGTQAFIQQKYTDNSCLLKMGKRLLKLPSGCSAVVGQMSNPEHNKQKFTTFGQKRWLGIKQRSGLLQKKSGRFGRKIGVSKILDFSKTEDQNEMCRLTYTKFGKPEASRKKGTFDKPAHLKPIPLEEGEIHPKFKWCTWSSVR